MQNSPLLQKSIQFAVNICRISGQIEKSSAGYVVSRQIVKSGTSIGANATEAQDASSRADFIAKMSISLREARETGYWLKILSEANLLSIDTVKRLEADLNEIQALLVTILKSSKSKTSTS